MTEETELPLAAEFPPASRDQWLKLVEGALKGAPFDKKLVGRTFDRLTIEPLYPASPAARPVAGRSGPWQVVQRLDHPDPATANAQALNDLENGATGLALVLAGSPGAHRYGIKTAALSRVLDGVMLDAGIALDLQLGVDADDAVDQVALAVERRGVAPASADIRFGLDPLGVMASTGDAPPWAALAERLAATAGRLAGKGFGGPFAVADGRVVHDAGGSEAQELAYALACALAYLRALEAGGIALDRGAAMIAFRLSSDADQFLTVAKFRALRKLWARVGEACGLSPAPAFVAAETAWRMMTRRDPWVNMLRATMAVFAAGIGGADAVTVLPHTLPLGLPDPFARRIARNTQLILLEESNLARVADPTAGAGGIEDLTQQLCIAAWSLFQDIEKAGGAHTALQQGLVQRRVAIVRTERQAAVATRKLPLTGTSEFPHLAEAPVAVLDVPPHVEEARPQPANSIEALPCGRLAEPFERLREASDQALAQSGSRPKIFLANLGSVAAFTTRAMFAKNFFETGGIEAVSSDGLAASSRTERPADDRTAATTTDLTALVAAYKQSGAQLACICSSDELYAGEAAAAAETLARAGCTRICLAGRPGAIERDLRAAGVSEFIFAGCDVLATLQRVHCTIAS